MTIITWMLFVLSITGNVLVIRKNRWGFAVWIVANAGWIAVNVGLGVWAAAAMFAVYLALAAWGFVGWKSNNRDKQAVSCVVLRLIAAENVNPKPHCDGCSERDHCLQLTGFNSLYRLTTINQKVVGAVVGHEQPGCYKVRPKGGVNE